MVLGLKIFFVEDKYGIKRFRHFQALFIAQTITYFLVLRTKKGLIDTLLSFEVENQNLVKIFC